MWYRHWRTKEDYQVIDPAVTDADTGGLMVYYRNKHGEGFVRSQYDFFGDTEEGLKRFELIHE